MTLTHGSKTVKSWPQGVASSSILQNIIDVSKSTILIMSYLSRAHNQLNYAKYNVDNVKIQIHRFRCDINTRIKAVSPSTMFSLALSMEIFYTLELKNISNLIVTIKHCLVLQDQTM